MNRNILGRQINVETVSYTLIISYLLPTSGTRTPVLRKGRPPEAIPSLNQTRGHQEETRCPPYRFCCLCLNLCSINKHNLCVWYFCQNNFQTPRNYSWNYSLLFMNSKCSTHKIHQNESKLASFLTSKVEGKNQMLTTDITFSMSSSTLQNDVYA